jgi:NAD+ kinase
MDKHKQFSKIAIIGRSGKPNIISTLTALEEYLLSIGKSVVVEANTAAMMPNSKVAAVAPMDLHQHAELIIVVGGDGSLLNAAHIALKNNLPILGINRGRLGFLTDICPTKLHDIKPILEGNYAYEERFLLGTTIVHQDQVIGSPNALNDIVLLHADATHMIHFSIHINNKFVCSQLADGLIIATPTGSTAYALSGGGPIMDPELETLALVPMLPHTLSNRPIVVDANQPISIFLHDNEDSNPAFISADGMERFDLKQNSELHITKKPERLTLIHARDYNYFTTLREKLGWQHYAERG